MTIPIRIRNITPTTTKKSARLSCPGTLTFIPQMLAISVVILPLTLIASIWGMNSKVPGQDNLAAFFVVLGGMLVILIGMVVWFKRRGWI